MSHLSKCDKDVLPSNLVVSVTNVTTCKLLAQTTFMQLVSPILQYAHCQFCMIWVRIFTAKGKSVQQELMGCCCSHFGHPFKGRYSKAAFTALHIWFGRDFYTKSPSWQNPAFYLSWGLTQGDPDSGPPCGTHTRLSPSCLLRNKTSFPMCQPCMKPTEPSSCSRISGTLKEFFLLQSKYVQSDQISPNISVQFEWNEWNDSPT